MLLILSTCSLYCLLSSSKISPCLPYVGAYLDMIYSLEIGIKTYNSDGLVNFSKMTKVMLASMSDMCHVSNSYGEINIVWPFWHTELSVCVWLLFWCIHLNYDIPMWVFVTPLLLSYHKIHYLFVLRVCLNKGWNTHNGSYNTCRCHSRICH